MNLRLQNLSAIDRVIHEPARLMIVALLFTIASADFLFLQRETGLSKGNLSVQLSRLAEAGYIHIEKTYRGKVPLTLCSITEAGQMAFERYRAHLRHLVDATDHSQRIASGEPSAA